MTRLTQTCTNSILLALSFILLSACGGSGGGTPPPPANSAPTASNVSVNDDNAGLAVVGDNLSGSYSYADAESDAEGTSTFSWLRDGSAINGATAASYVLDAADVAAQITFEVTPVAATGTATGSAVTSAGIAVASAPLAAAIPVLKFESVKTFRFDWTDVSDATHYKLLENPDSSAGFTQVGSDIPQGTQSIDHVVPLYARLSAQYILQSCNVVGCTDAASVAVSGSLVDSIGYFKASNTEAGEQFGGAVALSADGNTLAVGARREGSDAVGIDGDQGNNLALNSGAVYVFSRDSAGVWSGTPTYVKASNTEANDFFGGAVALSADGNTLAVGALFEDSEAVGIGGDQGNSVVGSASGAVYVFSRDNAGVWSGTPTYVKASNTEANDFFGGAVALSADGNTLAVGANGEAGGGISGNDNSKNASGAVYVYSRDVAGVWSDAFYAKASTVAINIDMFDYFGGALVLSADGNTLAVGAVGEDSEAVGINSDQANNLANRSGAVYVFNRDNADVWDVTPTYVKASNTEEDDRFGSAIALSANGNTLAVGATGESGAGISGNNNDTPRSGAVYVYSRNEAGDWSDAFYIKASTVAVNIDIEDFFGVVVALSADGNTLAVGAPGEDSEAVGIDGDQANNLAPFSGAVYVFSRDSAGDWGGTPTYVKASTTEADRFFGRAIALSADSNTLAVGAHLESSEAVGIGGDQANSMASNSGAVFVFNRDGGSWSQLAYVKASNTGVEDEFGFAVALSADGNTLAVGATDEGSDAVGINGDQADNTAPDSGAVYVY
jgi:hypothetical protein